MIEPPNIFEEVVAAESGLDSNQDSGRGGGVANANKSASLRVENPDDEARPLWNGRKPLYELKSERPEHRAIIMMTAAGMGNKEIADAIGFTAQTVMYIKKQPWAVKQILLEIERAGREPVMMLLKGAAIEAAEKQLDLMRNAQSEKVQSENAEKILDRVFGKSTQKMEISSRDPNEMTDEELLAIASKAKTN